MVAKIVPMPPRTRITDENLEIAQVACRDNAARCRREGAIERPATWEQTGELTIQGLSPGSAPF